VAAWAWFSFCSLRPLPLQDFVAAVAVPHHMTFESCDVMWQLGRGFRFVRCGRCRCRISLRPLPLQDFVAAVAGAGFCAAVAVPDHMTYESCDESGSWIVGGRVSLRPLPWQISLRSLPWQDFVAAVARWIQLIHVRAVAGFVAAVARFI